MIQHQELILSIKDAIKPGAFSPFYKPFTKEMVKEYFTKLMVKDSEKL
jgi:hypothetical protein